MSDHPPEPEQAQPAASPAPPTEPPPPRPPVNEAVPPPDSPPRPPVPDYAELDAQRPPPIGE